MPGAGAVRGTVSAVRRRPAVWALAAIVAIFLATRLAILWRFPPFLDESLYASWAKEIHDSGQNRYVPLSNGKLPLLPWLGAVVMWLGAAPLTAVRFVSLGSGLVSLGCVGAIGRRLGGTWTGVAAAGLYAVVPYFVVHDVIGLYEPLLTATAMLALYLQLRLADEPRLADALLLGLALGAGLLTKESGRFALVLLPFSLLCFRWEAPRRWWRLARWAGGAVLAVAVAGAMWSVLKLSEHYSILGRTAKQVEPVRSVGSGLAHPIRWLDFAWPGERTHILGYVTAPIVILAAIGLGLALRRGWRLPLFVLLWAALPFGAATLLAENTFARYTLQVAPPLAVLAAYGLVRLVAFVRTLPVRADRLAAGAAVATALVLLPAFLFDGEVLADPNRADYPGSSDKEYATSWTAGNAWVAVADELNGLTGSGRSTVTVFAQGSPALGLELHPNVVQEGGVNARFAIDNGGGIPADHGPGELRQIWSYQRPRNGTPLELYERGVTVAGRFYSTTADLRAGLNLGDKEFDAFVASHPEVKVWYDGAVADGT
jgi:dolichyl-phosphate-mannose-protein mannosyltransferase